MDLEEIANNCLDGMCYDEILVIALYHFYRDKNSQDPIGTMLGELNVRFPPGINGKMMKVRELFR